MPSNLWLEFVTQLNGLSGQSALIEGQSLALPAGVIRNTNNVNTFQPYDPAAAIGDTSPTAAAAATPPKKKGCGGIGTFLLAIIAVAVTFVTKGATSGFFSGLFSGTSLSAGTAAAAATIATGTTAAAAGSIVSQAVGVATGIQEKFNWKNVALAAITGGVGASGFGGQALGISNPTLQAMAQGAASSAISQGIGVVTGLQDKFSWAGVAAAGVGAGVGYKVGTSNLAQGIGAKSPLAADIFISGADAIANAATRTLIEGSDFGDNIAAALPSVLGGVIGNRIGGAVVSRMSEAARVRAAGEVARLGNQAPTAADVEFDNRVAGNAGGLVLASDRDSLTGGVAGTNARKIDFDDADGILSDYAKKELVKRGVTLAGRNPWAVLGSLLLPSPLLGQVTVNMGEDYRVVDSSGDRSAGRLEYRNGLNWEPVGPAEASFKDGFTRVIVHTDAAPIVMVMEGGRSNGGYFESAWAMGVGRGQTPAARAETFIYREIKLGNQGQFTGTLGLATAFRAEYQNQVDTAYADSFQQRFLPGSDKMPDELRRGIFVDRRSNAAMDFWLRSNGIREGRSGLVLLDRRLDRPSTNSSRFDYRRPDVYIPSAGIIMDAKLTRLPDSNPQIRDFRNFSNGATVLQITPRNKAI